MMQLGRKDVIGLDIGTTSVKLVQFTKDRKDWIVAAAGIAEISRKGHYGPSKHDNDVKRAIHNCINVSGVRGNYAVCAVGGPDVAVRSFDFPLLEEDEIDNAVLFEARQVCPFTTTDIAVDYQLCANGSKRTRGYLVAATNEQVSNRRNLLKKGRVDCVLMDIEAMALLNCFTEIEKPAPGHATAILNIGSSYTTLAIQGSDGQPFVRNISFSSEDLKSKLDESNITSTEDGKEVSPEIYEILVNAGKPLVADIVKTIRYYGAQQGCFDIQKILLCGEGTMLAGVDQMLKNCLGIDVEIWNPLDKIRCHAKIMRGVLLKNLVRKNGPVLAVAAGLAMRNI
jgi:type IV pilus assembly protein PilM